MSKETIYNEISKKYHYKNMANYNLLKPFIIWANANTMLDNFYKRPNINLSNSNLDNEIRNIMRHTTGLGLAASEYGIIAYAIGLIKELLDLLEDLLLHKPIGVISPEVWADTKIDFQNNHKGIQYMLNNPDATIDDLMNFAYNLAQERLQIDNPVKEEAKQKSISGATKYGTKKEALSNKNLYKLKDMPMEGDAPNLPGIRIPLPSEKEIYESASPLQGHVDINVNKDETTNSEQGFPTGLAADLFSEEEIEELKKRLEHERLPKETLEKMGEYHKRKFLERIRETYSGDFKDLTPANFIDKNGEFTFIPHDVEPRQTNLIAPTPKTKTQHTQSGKKDLSKDEKWQSFRKIFRTFFAMPDDNGKPMGKINSADVYNAIDVMETMKKAMHDSEVTQIPDSKGSIKDLNEFKFISDEAQTEMMQSALSQTSNQIKTDVKSEILDEISRQTMFPNREHVENIMRDVFDDVLVRRGYKKSN